MTTTLSTPVLQNEPQLNMLYDFPYHEYGEIQIMPVHVLCSQISTKKGSEQYSVKLISMH